MSHSFTWLRYSACLCSSQCINVCTIHTSLPSVMLAPPCTHIRTTTSTQFRPHHGNTLQSFIHSSALLSCCRRCCLRFWANVRTEYRNSGLPGLPNSNEGNIGGHALDGCSEALLQPAAPCSCSAGTLPYPTAFRVPPLPPSISASPSKPRPSLPSPLFRPSMRIASTSDILQYRQVHTMGTAQHATSNRFAHR
mmetsp:Transcript_11053/g.31753  ORF Transcript_11053/g.31753 Transcript_11053/m.31753 type:complete len:194 (+) Transcript_11053:30-611(+)